MSEGDRLAAIRERLEAATKTHHEPSKYAEVLCDVEKDWGESKGVVASCSKQADANFFAHAPEDIAYLLGRVEELEVWENDSRGYMEANAALISSLEAEVARLRDGLRKYGRHDKECDEKWRQWDYERAPTPCTCGLDSLLSGSGEGGRDP